MTAPSNIFFANLLDSAPGSFARDAVHALGPSQQDRGSWQESLTGWVQVLAAAVRSSRPLLFATHVTWLRAATVSRGETPDFLRRGMEALEASLAAALPEGGKDCLEPYFERAQDALRQDAFLPQSALEETPFADDAIGLIQDLIQGNAREASQRVRSMITTGTPPTDVILQLLLPVERELGRLWHLGELTIAEEHFGTRVIRRTLCDVLAAAEVGAPSRGCLLLAGAVGDEHDLGLAMLSGLFELDGWRAIDLGGNVPADELVTSAVHMAADVVVLSASLTTQIQSVSDSIQALRNRIKVRVIVGGYAFAQAGDLWMETGADGYGATMSDAVDLAR